jgi:tagatose-6-phosphate ketose/aldose isomerase
MHKLNKLLMMSEAEKSEKGLLHTPREIAQQPKSWRKTYLRFKERLNDINDFLERNKVKGDAKSRPAVFFVGAGTSDYVGKSLGMLLKQKWQCEVEAVPSTDLLTEMDDLILADRNYLWVSFSRSGDSSEGVAVLKSALEKYANVNHFIITCNENGSMARDFTESEKVFCLTLDDEVNDRGLAMTSSFSNMVVAGHCLANFQQLAEYESVLESMIRAGEDFLESSAAAASKLSEEDFSKICFLGTGALRAAAVESALKVLELTAGRIYTFSESFLGLRHGPLSAIDKNTLVIGFLSEDSRRRSYEVDLLADIRKKQLAGRILTVSTSGSLTDGGGEQSSEMHLTIDFQQHVADVYRVPVDIIFGQVLGLFSSLAKGLKPDTPSPTGAISRVVESVKVY